MPAFFAQALLRLQYEGNLTNTQPKRRDPDDPDLDLVERSRGGDMAAFRKLVERYQSRAHAIALGIVGNYQDAEDIVQDAFLKAYRSLGSFQGKSSFYTWLYRIIFNLAIDLSRKSYRKTETSIENAVSVDALQNSSGRDSAEYMSKVSPPDEQLRRAEIRERFDRALNELSPHHRAVIILREVDGLSYDEISRVVGCSKGTVMSRLHHARRRLQKALEEFAPSAKDTGDEEELKRDEG